MASREVVSVATGDFVKNVDRLRQSLKGEIVICWKDTLPSGPSHERAPYGFKISAIESSTADLVLWCDSSIIAIDTLNPLWDLIAKQGYWFSRNYGWNNAQFTNDQALRIMGVTRDQAREIPQVVAGCFGLNMRMPIAREFLAQWKDLRDAGAFAGDRGDLSGTQPDARGFYGHRNDQSCASHVCWKLGMTLTDPPKWFAEEGHPITDETYLTVARGH